MTQESGSSYKAIIYLLLVGLSVTIMHLNLRMSIRQHREEIRNMEGFSVQSITRKEKRSLQPETKKSKPSEPDTVVRQIQKEDTIKSVENEKAGDKEFFESLLAKYNAKQKRSENSKSRTDVIIRYYKKSKDGDRVYKLADLGFYIHERAAQGNFDEYSSNAIFYGDSVKKEDLMLIAYKLIESGVVLQSISLSKFHDAWKAHSVEIGTDTTALDEPAITLSSLRKTSEEM